MNAQLELNSLTHLQIKKKKRIKRKLEHYQKIHESIKSESKSSVYKVIKNSLEFLNPNTDLRGVISKMYDQASQTENFLDFKNNYKSAVRPGACVELSEEQDTHHSFNMNS